MFIVPLTCFFHVNGPALVDTCYSDLEVYYVLGVLLLSPSFPQEEKGKLLSFSRSVVSDSL